MKVEFISKRRPGQNYAEAPDRDWIKLTDFAERVVYFRPADTNKLIEDIQYAIHENGLDAEPEEDGAE